MLPNLAVLEKKCQALGLIVKQAGKRPAKEDFVRALREYHIPLEYPAGLPYTEVDPQLCFPIWNTDEAEAKALWNSPNWIAEWKENGARGVFHWIPGTGLFCHSRNVSVKTWRYDEMHQQFLPEVAQDLAKDFPTDHLVLDVELIIEKPVDTRPYTTKGVVTQTSLASTVSVLALRPDAAKRLQRDQAAPLTFKILDVIRWNDLDGTRAPLELRLKWRDLLFKRVAHDLPTNLYEWFKKPLFVYEDKAKFRDEVLAKGGEGVILKNLRAVYQPDARRRDSWVKFKKRIEFDCFVTGFERGDAGKGWENLVGDLWFSVNTEKGMHQLAKCSNLTMETRKAITEYDPATNTVSLKPEWYGRVAEISGQDVSSRSLRLSHATIERWRDQPGDEKSADQCVASMKDLLQAAEWVG